MIEKKLIDLETRIAYQDDLIDNLNNSVVDQQQRIDQLESGYRHLYEKLEEIMESLATGKIVDEKPPHY